MRTELVTSVSLTAVVLSIFFLTINKCARASANELAVGTQSAATSQFVDVPLYAPCDLNFKSRNDIVAIRREVVRRTPLLLRGEYNASQSVFGSIEDHKPWWGMHGQFVWGHGNRSIEGPAEESRFILNPYLLVGLNPWTADIWDTEKVTDSDVSRSDFPFCWMPSALRYWPGQSTAQAVYEVSRFESTLNQWKDKLSDTTITTKFGLVAYNARDFGFNYLYVIPQQSTNIELSSKEREPIEIKQFIHCGDSSNYPGGSNNMSPKMPDIDEFSYSKLPARVYVHLWKLRPSSASARPDMVFIIDLK